ncbi:hypothetical protein BWQ96_05480 [Gracilariopsis chorda]|uniref:Uncharacterized protein n=1 Tax=Gracilariopsis chorda TaxID=448386 RepID=A0A2V3IUK6_9FLOR|nr:hypothetical protein BWQ96_05480 [Gracilariopsis chorda]|eukprot:PXF44810.1 hypothetical protein BWQ96_05480 [Gracilariopsis chorda]
MEFKEAERRFARGVMSMEFLREVDMSVGLWLQMVNLAVYESAHKEQSAGSLPGKSPNILCDYATTQRYYMCKYFWPVHEIRPGTNQYGPEQNEKMFEIQFRMPRSTFNYFFTNVIQTSSYFRQGLRPDATG